MTEETKSSESRLEAIERKRAERKAAAATARAEQRAADLEALDALEQEHGDHAVKALDVDCGPGLPTLIVARAANGAEMKRYRHEAKPPKGSDQPRFAEAGERLGALVRIYPDDATFAKILEARPGVLLQLGSAALELATAQDAAAGKD